MTVFLLLGVGEAAAILGGAFALGLRHGVDWDHIAAITDITSTTSTPPEPELVALSHEPGVLLTDESQHGLATTAGLPIPAPTQPVSRHVVQKVPLVLGTLYAAGHGTMVVVLGLAAILFEGILPAWIDPVMERVVGVTLLLLAGFLFYSLYRHFRGTGEFHLRSRWMLVFDAVGRTTHRLRHAVGGGQHPHEPDPTRQYGAGTAYGIGLIHGIGAETGTQVLIIGTAVGADSKPMGIAALLVFVVGLLVSNSVVTLATAAGFVSAGRQRAIYVAVGIIAAIFSLVLGLVFLFEAGGQLPNLDRFVRWIGGPQ
ncbi:MAG: hypothetical protein IT301_12145 [Dehalococcoidia bacterium]|nr:hypothetical protein [Dehalococcoidia bacterium]